MAEVLQAQEGRARSPLRAARTSHHGVHGVPALPAFTDPLPQVVESALPGRVAGSKLVDEYGRGVRWLAGRNRSSVHHPGNRGRSGRGRGSAGERTYATDQHGIRGE